MPLIFHLGGPRHGECSHLSPENVQTSLLVYDGPEHFCVYQRSAPLKTLKTGEGLAEVWQART